MPKAPMLVVLIFIVLAGLYQSAFIVDQTEKALVLEFGKPVTEEALGPGLRFKIPFIQNVIYFDSRVLDYDAKPAEILTEDKKAMVLDNYTKWRIDDPLKFYQTARSIPRAQARLDEVIYSELRVALGNYTLIEVVSSKRTQIMNEVTEKSDRLMEEFGIEVLDVRVKRTDLPAENERAIFGRMRAERERQAKQYRSEGQEEASKIRSTADRLRSIIHAEAKRESEVLRGEGDATAIAIYAEALSADPEFYSFKRSLEAYERSFTNGSRFVLGSDDSFLKYMGK